jgi:hypothetical protein
MNEMTPILVNSMSNQQTNASVNTIDAPAHPVTVRLDDRIRLMSLVLAATDYPEKSHKRKPHGTHAHSRATRKYLADHASHPAIQTAQALLDQGAPIEALFTFAAHLTLPGMTPTMPMPAWVPANWTIQLCEFYESAEVEKWWRKERAVWDKALSEATKVFKTIDLKSFMQPFLGEIAEEFVFIPNISYPTDRDVGIRYGKELVCIAPPPLAWGDSPPWPYDEDTMLMQTYRAAITQYARILLSTYLKANPEKLAEATQSDLPVNDQFRALFPTWEEQFTELFVTALVAMYLEDHVSGYEYKAFVLMEQKVRGMNILPGTVSVMRRYIQEQGKKFQSLADFLPIFPKQLRVAKRIVTL